MAVLNTHKVLFAYNRLTFGIASAPALFQRRLESIVQGLPCVKVYLDDIIVAEKQYDDSTLRRVFERLRDNGLKLTLDKCRFHEKQVSFLGHKIDATGLHPPDNMEAITAAPRPETFLPSSNSSSRGRIGESPEFRRTLVSPTNAILLRSRELVRLPPGCAGLQRTVSGPTAQEEFLCLLGRGNQTGFDSAV
ncbi:uncharacterized protein K02A2.6-like [Rhipicephalus sanguineus]|uniref:uncharacterized protein K02A2.6-like n=1 Tax=Rhipicephalus sanguineus TaxID=34632 RepID=UPI0020C37C32|nr:uncharacterized protein K02A2.6-like [Rhipicephalus sanguineus]